jgi:hypothetical protein
MPPDADRRSFVAHDADGNRYLVVASRPVGRVPATDRPGPWAFRTLDGRAVRPAACHHRYAVQPDGIPLYTSDPNEPAD